MELLLVFYRQIGKSRRKRIDPLLWRLVTTECMNERISRAEEGIQKKKLDISDNKS